MAHKKGVGSTDNGRDSNAKYLGVKLFGGQAAIAGLNDTELDGRTIVVKVANPRD